MQTTTTHERALLSIAEAAELAGISRSVAYRLAASKQLPGLIRLPGVRMLVRRRMLESWLAGNDPAALADRETTGVETKVRKR